MKTSPPDFCCFLAAELIRHVLDGYTQHLIIRWKGPDLIHAFCLGSMALLSSSSSFFKLWNNNNWKHMVWSSSPKSDWLPLLIPVRKPCEGRLKVPLTFWVADDNVTASQSNFDCSAALRYSQEGHRVTNTPTTGSLSISNIHLVHDQQAEQNQSHQ